MNKQRGGEKIKEFYLPYIPVAESAFVDRYLFSASPPIRMETLVTTTEAGPGWQKPATREDTIAMPDRFRHA